MSIEEAVREAYPDEDWERFSKAIVQAKDHLQWGPSSGYSFSSAIEVLQEINDLSEFYYDPDTGTVCHSDPREDPSNWEDEMYTGPWNYELIDPRLYIPALLRSYV